MPNLDKNIVLMESSMNPLKKVDDSVIKMMIINPITGKPREDVIILEGVFAILEGVNNNNREYDIESYLKWIGILKTKIFSKKGLYGEYEHPSGYNIDSNNLSHKILDIWYIPETKTVMGRVMLLNKGKGLLAREVIETGGQLAISGRAGGKETKGPNGTFISKVELLVTFDLVYHPGFENAVLDYITLDNLNESVNGGTRRKIANELGYSIKLYESALPDLDGMYSKFLQDSTASTCFMKWCENNGLKQINESKSEKSQNKIEEKKMQDGDTHHKNNIQNELQKSVEKDLGENQKVFFQELQKNQNVLKFRNTKKSKQGKSYYDNSAGFVNEGLDLSEDEF